MDDVLHYYAPPQTTVTEDTDKLYDRPILASRGNRLAAHMVDSVIGWGATFIPIFVPFLFDQSDDMAFALGLGGLLALIGIGSVSVLNLWWLHTDGQTLGKKVVGIRIVRSNLRDRASLFRIVGLRFAPLASVSLFVPFAMVVDALFIFGSERRCLHDLFADTAVIDAATWQPNEMDFTTW